VKQVKDFIFKDLSSINEDSSLRRVIKTMRLHRISALPVVNHLGEYVGCISDQDILQAAIPEYMKWMYDTSFMADLDQITLHLQKMLDEKAIKFVNKDYPTVAPDNSMSYAADLLFRSQGTILPVVEGKMLIGLVSRLDILSVSLDS
jgi:CBS domain-containing protein